MTTMSDNDPKYPLLQNEETGQSAYPPYPPSYGSGGNAANGPTFPQGQFMNQVVHHQPMPMAANQTTVIHSTSVVTTQPAGRIWQAGLCDCCSDCGVCMWAKLMHRPNRLNNPFSIFKSFNFKIMLSQCFLRSYIVFGKGF